MRSFVVLAALTAIVVIPASALGAFCSSYSGAYPKTVFCDDFDRYCPSPPLDGSNCPAESPTVNGPLQNVWVPMDPGLGQCPGTTFTVEADTTRLDSAPFGGRYPCQSNSHLGQQEVNLVPRIQANPNFGPSYTAVNGTDANQLYLYFVMNGGNDPPGAENNLHIQYDNGYIELGLDGNPGAPMDFVKVGADDGAGCSDCFHTCPGPHYSVHVPWGTICQSYTARAINPGKCPPAMTTVRKALAVGAVALLDNNPCHCETPADQVPQNQHLSFYDGLKWRILKTGDGYTTSGDFAMGTKVIYVQMWIKTNTVDISMQTRAPDTNTLVTSTAVNIPRQYTGAFNRLRGGAAHGCELQNGSYNCTGNDTCFRTGEFRCDGGGFQDSKASNIIFDNVWLLPGVGATSSQTGACCMPNATCQQTATAVACTNLGGTFSGLNSTCSSTVCCHKPVFADVNNDGDVDMDDFAEFQKCFTGSQAGVAGSCKCFDKNNDDKVDVIDFTSFTNCVSGPKVPWSPANTPSCVP